MKQVRCTVFVDAPGDFNFRSTVWSHGWSELPPFELDEVNWRLRYVFRSGDRAVSGVVSEERGRIRVDLSDKIDTAAVARDTRHMLRLDDDLGGFYDAVATHEGLAWVGERGGGRLLRSPTVWEDLVKTICTTNCSWGLTKKMAANLVAKLGSPARDGLRAFPTPQAMAGMSEAFYRDEIRSGYRSPYLIELAAAVASGNLDPESWFHSDLSTSELKKEMKMVKGMGDYAAEHLLKLVGRYEGLALDSALRSRFYRLHNKETVCPDEKIERHYNKFGKWRGLVIWCDMTSEPPV
jgi:3-methyladenine DNA glycosylase/8-oxoguanine DNA glycosylase